MDPKSDHTASPEPADDFRRRLKDLGYLENPLDKFFIGGSHGRTGVFLANVKIALKVGVLGGVFLGVVTAFGLELLSRESFSAHDVAKLAAYFSIVFTGIFSVLELLICLAVTLLGRTFRRLFTRTQMIALYSGVFAGLFTALYGAAWWWAVAAEDRLLSSNSLVALLVTAALSLAIGLLTRLAVTALLATLGGADLTARGKGRATKLYFAVLVVCVAAFVGFRLAAARDVPLAPSTYQRADSPLSVTIVAIDGADYDFLSRAIASGDCPNLAAFRDGGFSAPLSRIDLRVNPAVWTTLATGVYPAKHSVTSYSGLEIPGLGLYINDRTGFGLYDALLAAMPAVGLSRRAPLERAATGYGSLWDICAQKGALSGVVNWWGTWPADDFHGFLVSDRMYPKLQVSKALSRSISFEREVYPPVLFDSLSTYPITSARVSEDPLQAARDIDHFAVTALLTGSLDYPRIDLSAVYLPGLDIFTNALHSSVGDAWSVAAAASIVDGTSSYWRFLDELIDPLLRRASPSHVVMVVADPGMAKGPQRASRASSETGFLIMAGGPVAVASSPAPVALVDIAPAVLYLLGFPVSREFDGELPAGAFLPAAFVDRGVVYVDTFGRIKPRSEGKYSVDAELVDNLRSLGYIQ